MFFFKKERKKNVRASRVETQRLEVLLLLLLPFCVGGGGCCYWPNDTFCIVCARFGRRVSCLPSSPSSFVWALGSWWWTRLGHVDTSSFDVGPFLSSRSFLVLTRSR